MTNKLYIIMFFEFFLLNILEYNNLFYYFYQWHILARYLYLYLKYILLKNIIPQLLIIYLFIY